MEVIKEFKGKYRFLSNFSPSIIEAGGITYFTMEHYYQAMKTPITSERLKIARVSTATETKRLGRQVILRPDWEDIKIPIMKWGLIEKFKHPELAKLLLATGNAYLTEGNYWHDNIWGDCYCGRPACIEPGQNLLGKTLMEVRDILK